MNSSRDPFITDVISSAKNTWVQSVVSLHRPRDRYAQKRFLVEGSHAVQEAAKARWPVELIVASETWMTRYLKSERWLPSHLRVQLVSDSIMNRLATTETPEGILAICLFHTAVSYQAEAAIIDSHPAADLNLAIVAEKLQDPGNLGTLTRSAVACNATGVFLTEGSVDPFHPKVLRSSAGQWFQTPPRTISKRSWIETCRTQGVRIFATAAQGCDYWDVDFSHPTVFLLGNEGAGLSEELFKLADDVVAIPMANQVESLNVAMTGTLLLYEAARQRRSQTSQ